MAFEPYECIDAGTEYCPCHLAETGDCILCSQLQKCDCCHCEHWKGVCIYQEFVWNNCKAKKMREYHKCKIIEKKIYSDSVVIFTIKAQESLLRDLTPPGSFVFLRKPKDVSLFDFPISLMDVNLKEHTMKLAIQLVGVKTNRIDELKENDDILIKGPYWNGILGLKHIKECPNNSTCVLIGRGIGQAPMIPVLKALNEKKCRIITIIDKGKYPNVFVDDYIDMYNPQVILCNTLEKGDLTLEFKEILLDTLINEKPYLVHCDGADILNYNVMKGIDAVNESEALSHEILYSCCNNAKMCCGEGVCGCCTRKNNDRVLRRMCKMQTDPKYVLEGRRKY